MDNSTYLMPDEPLRFAGQDIKAILNFAQTFEVSDITLQTGAEIIAEIYGKLRKITRRKLSNTEVGDIINYIYGPNGTTIMLSGKDIDTNYEFKPNRLERYRYRVNSTACLVDGHQGIQITLRTIPTDPLPLSMMDLPPEIIENMSPHDGCVYITGATGSGKSTLLSSIIRDIAEDEDAHRKILTYESPIEFVYDNINAPSCVISQSEIPKHLPSFAAGVRNALRRKPRLILVGESRDHETINACLDAALTGHPVYTTVHSNGVAETMRRLVGSFPKEERRGKTIDIIETMRLIIWQKLVPTVDGKRTALREYLIFNDDVRDELLNYDPTEVTVRTREILERQGITMSRDARNKLDQGIISQETYNKIVRLNTQLDQDLNS